MLHCAEGNGTWPAVSLARGKGRQANPCGSLGQPWSMHGRNGQSLHSLAGIQLQRGLAPLCLPGEAAFDGITAGAAALITALSPSRPRHVHHLDLQPQQACMSEREEHVSKNRYIFALMVVVVRNRDVACGTHWRQKASYFN